MKPFPFFFLVFSLLFLVCCNKEELPKVCSVTFEQSDSDCSDIAYNCSAMTFSNIEYNAMGWINSFDYSGCGESGSVIVNRANNGCISNIDQSCN